jgi:hypothetical protein
MCLGLDLARLEMRALFTAHIEAEERALNDVLRSVGQLIAPSNYGGSLQPREGQKPCDRSTVLTCTLGVTCDARCHESLRLRRIVVAGSGFHRALPQQPRESGDRPSSRILGSM